MIKKGAINIKHENLHKCVKKCELIYDYEYTFLTGFYCGKGSGETGMVVIARGEGRAGGARRDRNHTRAGATSAPPPSRDPALPRHPPPT